VVAAIDAHAGFELAGIVYRPSELLSAAERADVAVVAAEDGAVPGIASHLLDQYPDLTVLALLPDDRGVLLHALRPQTVELAGIGPAALATAITAACCENGRELP
jgi:hypothetical protein